MLAKNHLGCLHDARPQPVHFTTESSFIYISLYHQCVYTAHLYMYLNVDLLYIALLIYVNELFYTSYLPSLCHFIFVRNVYTIHPSKHAHGSLCIPSSATCLMAFGLTHWCRETHLYVGNPTIIGSDNGLSPGRRQDIIWTNAGILLIDPWEQTSVKF